MTQTTNEWFRHISAHIGEFTGSATAFFAAFAIIIVWIATGPSFQYSNTWQLVINTGTTIVTFLMVFLIQNMQNRESKALHLKVDELIRASKNARNSLVDIENMTDVELDMLQEEFRIIHAEATKHGVHKFIAK